MWADGNSQYHLALAENRMKLLDHCWRVVATGICFAMFSLSGLVLTGLVFPSVNLFVRNDSKRLLAAQHIVHRNFRVFMALMSLLGVIEFDVREARLKLVDQRGKIIVANHPSLIDVVVLVSLLPHAVCIVKQELWNNVFFKGVLNAAGYIKNSGETDTLIETCRKALDMGCSLIVFPEGSRTVPNHPMELKRGASQIALRSGVDIVPVLINVSPTTLTKNERWYHVPAEKVTLTIRVGEPITTTSFQREDQSLAVRARRLTACIAEYFNKGFNCYE